jgi:hypothetical protein
MDILALEPPERWLAAIIVIVLVCWAVLTLARAWLR